MAIIIKIDVDEKGSVKAIKDITGNLEKLDKQGKQAATGVGGLTSNLGSLKAAIGAVGVAYLTREMVQLGTAALNVSGSFERMQISLDTITKGRGQEWFDKLNQWALEMPVNTEKAIQSFTMLKAMGLDPTIADMTTLVDTTSALGGQSDTLSGIARALGQIQTKGKVSAEELMQLAERGVPAYEILREKMGLTAKEVANIGNAGVDAEKAIAALIQGMDERFGGQSKRIMESYSGIIESIRSNWVEWIRVVMDTGPFEGVKTVLKEVRDISEGMAKGAKEQARLGQADKYLTSLGLDPMIAGDVTTGAPNIWSKEQLKIYDQAQEAVKRYNEWLRKLTETNEALGKAAETSILATEQAATRILNEQQSIFDNYAVSQKEKAESDAKLTEEYGNKVLNYQQMVFEDYALKQELKKEADEEYKDAYKQMMAELEREEQKAMDRAVAFGQKWGDMWYSAMNRSGNAIKNFAEVFEAQMARIAVASTISGLFNLATGGIGGFQGGFMSGITNELGLSGKAAGGPVMAGEAYVVGERGPELFMPNVSGKIVPNNQITNNDNRNVSVNVSLSRMTAREFDEMIEDSKYARRTA